MGGAVFRCDYTVLLELERIGWVDFIFKVTPYWSFFLFQGNDPDDAWALWSVLVVSACLTPDQLPVCLF